MHSFTTDRLLIRPITEQDQALYCSLYTDEKIMRHIGAPLNQAQAEKAFSLTVKLMKQALLQGRSNFMTWVIVTKTEQETIGILALTWNVSQKLCFELDIPWQAVAAATNKPQCSQPHSREPQIGIMINQGASGKLYPGEAMGALMEYSFNYLAVEKIHAFQASQHLATIRFTKKLGFTFDEEQQPTELTTMHRYFNKGQWHEQLITQVF